MVVMLFEVGEILRSSLKATPGNSLLCCRAFGLRTFFAFSRNAFSCSGYAVPCEQWR